MFLVFPLLPFFHGFLPVGLLTAFHRCLLTRRLVPRFVTGALGFHCLNGCIIMDLNGTTLHSILQLFLAKGFPRLIEV